MDRAWASGSRDHCRRHAFPSRPNRGLLGAEINLEARACWSAVFSVEGLTAPIFVWLEETDAPTAQHATDMAGVPEHKWTMVWQTRLDGADPVADWGLVLRTIGLSWPGTPAVHDVELSRWIMREEMMEPLLADEELEPAVESLWWVSASQREPGSPAWLKTSGMNRLGLPELEFLEVPVPLVPTTAHLLDELAARIVEDGPPPPGTRMAVGPELELRAVPPREVLPVLPANMPGQAADREPDAPPSIVFTGPEKVGATRPTWPPATSVLQRLADEPCVVYRATRNTKRRAHLARQTWDDLGMIHAKLARLDTKAMFAVKAVFGPESAREHCWLRVDTLEGNAASGVLDADTQMVPGLQEGVSTSQPRRNLWCVVLNDKRFDPESVPALWRVIDELSQNLTLGGKVLGERPASFSYPLCRVGPGLNPCSCSIPETSSRAAMGRMVQTPSLQS